MKTQLIFIHGRSLQFNNAQDLKDGWIKALRSGLAQNNLTLPILPEDIRFPYYGQALYDLVDGASDAANVILKGPADTDERDFIAAVAQEMQSALAISDSDVRQAAGAEVMEKGPQDWRWVGSLLRLIDSRIGGASRLSVAVFTRDVYKYLKNPGIRDTLEEGVLQAFTPGVRSVVVAHSLGSVLAYNILKREGKARGWVIPTLITIGCPLGIRTIRQALRPIGYPACVDHWLNARDRRDVVALYPLDPDHFGVTPAIENNSGVRNQEENRHAAIGYLNDASVAQTIYAALA
jgi:hypothetical protein